MTPHHSARCGVRYPDAEYLESFIMRKIICCVVPLFAVAAVALNTQGAPTNALPIHKVQLVNSSQLVKLPNTTPVQVKTTVVPNKVTFVNRVDLVNRVNLVNRVDLVNRVNLVNRIDLVN